MRIIAPLAVLICVSRVGAEEPKNPAPGKDTFAACVKVLNYGQENDYYDPSRTDAVHALGLLGDERAVPILAEHLANEKNDHLRFQIVRALGWLNSRKAVPSLEKALKDRDMHVRNGAAMALKQITGKDYKPEQGPLGQQPRLADLLKELGPIPGFDQHPEAGKSFLEVGKSYRFGMNGPGADISGKVLEILAGTWVKLEIRKNNKATSSWLNLAVVATVRLEQDEK